MLDALSSATSASLTTLNQALVSAAAQTAAPTVVPTHINVNAPAGISPAISFNRETDEVIFTYRSAETGQITEQIPPAAANSRYLAVSDSGDAAASPPSRPGASSNSNSSAGSQPSSSTGTQASSPQTGATSTAITPNANPTPAASNTLV